MIAVPTVAAVGAPDRGHGRRYRSRRFRRPFQNLPPRRNLLGVRQHGVLLNQDKFMQARQAAQPPENRVISSVPAHSTHHIRQHRQTLVTRDFFKRHRQTATPVGVLVHGARHIGLVGHAENVFHGEHQQP